MKTALYSALLLLALALTGAVLVLSYDTHQDLASAHQVLEQATVTGRDLQGTITRINGTVGTLDQAAAEERSNWNATSKEAAKTGAALRMLIDRVDRSLVDGTLYHLNSQTLPAIDAQVAANGDELRAAVHKLGATADALPPVMAQTQKDLATLDLVIGDARPLLANSTATMANAEKITADLAKIADDATAPQPWYKRAWGYIWAPVKITAVFLK